MATHLDTQAHKVKTKPANLCQRVNGVIHLLFLRADNDSQEVNYMFRSATSGNEHTGCYCGHIYQRA